MLKAPHIDVIMKYDSERFLTKEELKKVIGSSIKKIRQTKGISQAELARLCGKDKQHIELIENSKILPNAYTLYTITRALDVDPNSLFSIRD